MITNDLLQFKKKINPISRGEGGGIYLKCHLSPKISRIGGQRWGHVVLKFKLGHMRPNKKGFGSENFFGPDPGARKVRPPENLSISNFGIFDFGPKFEP